MRDDFPGIPCVGVSPQKRRAMEPGADIGGVGALCLSELTLLSCHNTPRIYNFAASLVTPTSFRAVKFGDAPCC